jgi:DNA helicase-2/ATP-dependent DNA helicase PcrA
MGWNSVFNYAKSEIRKLNLIQVFGTENRRVERRVPNRYPATGYDSTFKSSIKKIFQIVPTHTEVFNTTRNLTGDQMITQETDPWLMTADPQTQRLRMEGTDQQENFWSALVDGSGDLILNARAGTGKTTTCLEGMHRLHESTRGSKPRITYCCFNKSIALEFQRKTPKGVEVGTMHSLGLKGLQRCHPLMIEKNKSYMMLDSLGHENLPRYTRRAVCTLVSLAKNHGMIPRPDLRSSIIDKLWGLIEDFDIETYGKHGQIASLAYDVLVKSAAITTVIDFDDMLWLPVVMSLNFPASDYLFIDEAQDLNPLQHTMVGLLNPEGRTIVVGDPAQSIYAFRGADVGGMAKLSEILHAEEFPLNVTWRCPRSHVRLAQDIVPDLQAAPNAIEGTIDHTNDLTAVLDHSHAGDLVLCRANAPLLKACLEMIASGRKATMRGRSIGDNLKLLARRMTAGTIPEYIGEVSRWRSKELARLSEKEGSEQSIEEAEDRSACLESIAISCQSPSEISGQIDFLFTDGSHDDKVVFSSIHRAKGSEADHVVLIEKPYAPPQRNRRPPAWEWSQRSNLAYVSQTRAMQSLTIVHQP